MDYPKEFIVSDNEDWTERINDIKSGKIKFNFDFLAARIKILKYYSSEARNALWLKNVFMYYEQTKRKRWIRFLRSIHLIFEKEQWCNALRFFEKEKNGDERVLVFFHVIKIKYKKKGKKHNGR